MKWFAWALAAIICWGIWAVIGRLIGDALSPAHSQALSTLGLLPVVAMIGFSVQRETGRRTRGLILGFAAGVLTCVGNIAYYHVLNSGAKAATVVPLTAMYPLVTVLLALWFLRERLNGLQWGGVGLSLAAIYAFNVRGEEGLFSSWLMVAMLPIVFWGVSGFAQKVSTNHISGELSTLSFLLAFVPVALLILVREPLPAKLEARVWWLSLALGFSFALGNFAILQAFAKGKASVVAPLGGLYPLISVPIAVIAFREKIVLREALGIGAALLAILALSLESRAEAPSVTTSEPVLK